MYYQEAYGVIHAQFWERRGTLEKPETENKGEPRKCVIDVKDLYKIYPIGKNEVRALNGVSFQVYEGEFCAIVGASAPVSLHC